VVPKRVTKILVESEARIVDSWAQRNGWTVNINLERLEITAEVPHPKDNAPLFLQGDLSGYRAIPPAWRFVDESGNVTKAAFPAAGPVNGKSSIFHGNVVICAPFNRLAYKIAGGPHEDWGEWTGWFVVTGDFAKAYTLAEMLSIINVHLQFSPGRMQ
jgi:hypothetical protein